MDQEKKQQLIDLLNNMSREYTYQVIKYAAEEEGISPQELSWKEAVDFMEKMELDVAIRKSITSIAYGMADKFILDLEGLPPNEALDKLSALMKNQNSDKEKEDVFKTLASDYLRRSLELVATTRGEGLTPDLLEEWRRLTSSNNWENLIDDTFMAIFLNSTFKEIEELNDYLTAEIKAPEYLDYTLDDLLIGYVNNDPEKKELFTKAISSARIKAGHAKRLPPPVYSLFNNAVLPMYNGPAINDLMRLSIRDFAGDNITKAAVYDHKGKTKYIIKAFDNMLGNLNTSAKKILDTSVAYLSDANHFMASPGNIIATVRLPLIEYGEANGYKLTPETFSDKKEQEKENKRVKERIKELRRNIQKDLRYMSNILWSAEAARGPKYGEYEDVRIISSSSISGNIIEINFDVKAANYLTHAYVMQYPIALLKHDNRRPNSYVIGRKIALHNSMDNNNSKGIDCTLSVKKLLDSAPEIPTIEDIKNRGQRNWRDKIKKALEIALNDNIKVGLITKWEYRDPKTGTIYNAEESQGMIWSQYNSLMVDWIMAESPQGQLERREKREAEKLESINRAPAKRKKRGRPRKSPQK